MAIDKIIKLISFFIISFCFVVYAESGSLGELDDLQKQRFLYEVTVAVKKAKQEANKYGEPPLSVDNHALSLSSDSTNANLPLLIKINGKKAVIALSEGSTRSVTIGEILPCGRYQVQNITLKGLSLRRLSDDKTILIN